MNDELKIVGILRGIHWLFNMILGFFSFPVEVLIRRDFGERYYKILTLLVMFVVLNTFAIWFPTSGFPSEGEGVGGSGMFLFAFAYLFLIVGVYHYFVIWNRNRKGQRWHSKAIGEPLAIFYKLPKVDKMKIHRFVEPAFVLIIAFLMSFIDGLLAVYLVIAAVGLASIAHLMYLKFRNQELDMIDAEIESTNIIAAMSEAPQSKTEGYTLTGAKNLAPKLKERLTDRITKQHEINNAIETAITNPLVETPVVKS